MNFRYFKSGVTIGGPRIGNNWTNKNIIFLMLQVNT